MKTRSPRRELPFRTWGGRRKNAGRKSVRATRDGPSHRARGRFNHRRPCHVTLRCISGLPNLREKGAFARVKSVLSVVAEDWLGLRIVHFSVQRNHLHLIVEAESWAALSAGMKGLEVRLARAINRLASRHGRVFRHRYDVKILGSPRQVRATLVYVLGNARKHAAQAGVDLPRRWIDPRSSAPWFDGWANGPPASTEAWPLARTWLLRAGWRKHGAVRIEESPRT